MRTIVIIVLLMITIRGTAQTRLKVDTDNYIYQYDKLFNMWWADVKISHDTLRICTSSELNVVMIGHKYYHIQSKPEPCLVEFTPVRNLKNSLLNGIKEK